MPRATPAFTYADPGAVRGRTAFAAMALAAAVAIFPAPGAQAAYCAARAVHAAGAAPDEPLAAYRARANWDAQVRGAFGLAWAEWGAAEGAMLTCGRAKRGGHVCIAGATPCYFAGTGGAYQTHSAARKSR